MCFFSYRHRAAPLASREWEDGEFSSQRSPKRCRIVDRYEERSRNRQVFAGERWNGFDWLTLSPVPNTNSSILAPRGDVTTERIFRKFTERMFVPMIPIMEDGSLFPQIPKCHLNNIMRNRSTSSSSPWHPRIGSNATATEDSTGPRMCAWTRASRHHPAPCICTHLPIHTTGQHVYIVSHCLAVGHRRVGLPFEDASKRCLSCVMSPDFPIPGAV
jgi:hypothetical protein